MLWGDVDRPTSMLHLVTRTSHVSPSLHHALLRPFASLQTCRPQADDSPSLSAIISPENRHFRRLSIRRQQFSSIAPPTMQLGRYLGLRPSRELGLLSLLFVLSTAIGALFSLAVISLPTMHAFRRLGISAGKLSKVVSEEVPGTLSSFKLSGLEINDLTQQLSNLRQIISGNRNGKKEKMSMPKASREMNNPIVN